MVATLARVSTVSTGDSDLSPVPDAIVCETESRSQADTEHDPGEPPLDSSGEKARRLVAALPWLIACVIPFAIQLLFGVDDVGHLEEWGVQLRFDSIGPVFWTPSDSGSLGGHAIRPLTVAPHALAYALNPDSFAWYHVLQALGLALKAFGMMLLLRRLRLSAPTAFVGAVAFALFPAWNGLFTFRTIHMQFAVALFVIALAELVAFHARPSWLRAISCTLALGLSLMLYEVTYVAAAIAPLVLLLANPKTVKAMATSTAVWFVAPALNAVRILYLWRTSDGLYQQDLAQRGVRSPAREIWQLVRLVVWDGPWSLVNPVDGFAIIGPLTVAAALMAVATVVVISRGTDRATVETVQAPSTRSLLLLGVAGVAAAPVAAMIYWPQPAHLADPLRVFSVASIGLALGGAAVLELIRRIDRTSGAASVSVALATVVLVVLSAAAQRATWNEHSTFQEHVLGAIVGADLRTPPSAGQSLVIVDPTRVTGSDVYHIIPEYMNLSLDYLLPGPGLALVCNEFVTNDAAANDEALAPGVCEIGPDSVRSQLATATLPETRFIEIRVASPGSDWPGDPVAVPTRRLDTIVDCVVDGTCDEGPNGIQARVIEGRTLLSIPSGS